jgi:ankyrin repeat protein
MLRPTVTFAARQSELHELRAFIERLTTLGYSITLEDDCFVELSGNEKAVASDTRRVIAVGDTPWEADPFAGDWRERYDARTETWRSSTSVPVVLRLTDAEVPSFLFEACRDTENPRTTVVDAFRNWQAAPTRLEEALELAPRDPSIDLANALLVRSNWGIGYLFERLSSGMRPTVEALLEIEPALPAHVAKAVVAVCWDDAAAVEGLLKTLGEGDLLASGIGPCQLSLLHLACLLKEGQRVVELLLRRGAPPDARTKFGVTPLCYAAWTGNQMVRALLEHGADATLVGRSGENPLGAAAWTGNADAFGALLRAGGDPFITDPSGGHSLTWAAQQGHLEIIDMIVGRFPEDVDVPTGERGWGSRSFSPDERGLTPIERYCRTPRPSQMTTLGATALHSAASAGSEPAVVRLLAAGADPTRLDANNQTPVHLAVGRSPPNEAAVRTLLERAPSLRAGEPVLVVAVSYGTVAIVRLLLERGHDANGVDSRGVHVIHHALWRESQEVVHALLDAGANANAIDPRGFGALHIAVSLRSEALVGLLLDAGADPNLLGRSGLTPLEQLLSHRPSQQVSEEPDTVASCAALLLARGARPNGNSPQPSPLHLAARLGREDVVRLLLARNPDVDARDDHGETPLHDAVRASSLKVAEALLGAQADPNARNQKDLSPLFLAVNFNRWELAALLIAAGAQLISPRPNIESVVVVAALAGRDDLLKAWLVRFDISGAEEESVRESALAAAAVADLDRLKEYAAHGIPLDARSGAGWRPIALAASRGHADVVRFLLEEAGAVVSSPAGAPLPLACAAASGNAQLVDALMAVESELSSQGTNGGTSLHFAAAANQHGILAQLIDRGCSVHTRDFEGRSPLHVAAWSDAGEACRVLLERGASSSARNRNGEHPVHIAAARGNAGALKAILDGAAAPDLARFDGRTPLHLAALNGQTVCAELLLEAGSDLAREDDWGSTPLALALKYEREEVAAALVERGASIEDADDACAHAALFAGVSRPPAALAASFESLARRLTGEADKLETMAIASLPFYEGVSLVKYRRRSFPRSKFALWSETRRLVRTLEGDAKPIHDCNHDCALSLDEENVIHYLRFFLAFVRSDIAPFLLVESTTDIQWTSAATAYDRERAERSLVPCTLVESSSLASRFECAVLYQCSLHRGQLYVAKRHHPFRVSDAETISLSTGDVRMLESREVESNLRVRYAPAEQSSPAP